MVVRQGVQHSIRATFFIYLIQKLSERVLKLKFTNPGKGGKTKIQQLVHAISEAIVSGELKEGDALPSVNRLSSDSGYSRDTVFKAYRILKETGMIESAPTRNYYVTGGSFRVLMVLDDFSAFKEQLYQSFRSNLPDTYSVDLLFHHYNREVFRQLILNSLGRYSVYVVMNINHAGMESVLEMIDQEKLLILDMGMPSEPGVSYIIQNFYEAVIRCMDAGLRQLKKYKELVLVYDEKRTPHPAETTLAVKHFCENYGIGYRQVKSASGQKVHQGECWFTIHDSDLVEVIKNCRKGNLSTGVDVGILSYNDTPMKQIVEGGITVISTDFVKMGVLAAGFVKTRQNIAEVLPTSLILRESL